MTGRMIPPKEAAALTGVDVNTVRRWAVRGYVSTYLTPGGHHRYDADEVQAWVQVANPQTIPAPTHIAMPDPDTARILDTFAHCPTCTCQEAP